jgi:hypothetical protein
MVARGLMVTSIVYILQSNLDVDLTLDFHLFPLSLG